jgi:hypothetical protein
LPNAIKKIFLGRTQETEGNTEQAFQKKSKTTATPGCNSASKKIYGRLKELF